MFKPALKVFLVYLVFMLMYAAYRFFPVFPLSIVCGVSESTFQHFKATFFAFLIVDLIEFLVFRKRIEALSGFWHARLLAAVVSPWPVFLMWYIAPALHGQFHPVVWEILYANGITILASAVTVTLERGFLRMPFSGGLKRVVWALLGISLLLYMVFTFSHLPWADVFVEPQWR
jgi:hypothetical protein